MCHYLKTIFATCYSAVIWMEDK